MRVILGGACAIIVVAVMVALRPDSGADEIASPVPEDAVVIEDPAETQEVAPFTESIPSTPSAPDSPSERVVTRQVVGETIEGIVRFAKDGAPAAGATITARRVGGMTVEAWEREIPFPARGALRANKPASRQIEIRTKSGSDGRFVLTGVGSDSWLLDCELEGYLAIDPSAAIARAGSRRTFDLEPATRVDIELVDPTGVAAEIVAASLTWSGNDRTLYLTWTKERPYVRVPADSYVVGLRSVESIGGMMFATGAQVAELIECVVGVEPRTLRIPVMAARSLSVSTTRDSRFARSTKFYVMCRPESPLPSESPAEFAAKQITEQISVGRTELLTNLEARRYQVTLHASRNGRALVMAHVDLTEKPQKVVLDLAAADLGDPLGITFTSARGDAELVTIESCLLVEDPNSGIVITTTRDADRHYTIHLERELRRRMLESTPDARLELIVRHPRSGSHSFEIPLALVSTSCVLLEPAHLRVTLDNKDARRTTPGIVASLARLERGVWKSLCKPQDMAWVDEVTLGPIAPGDCSLIISSDFSLDRPLLIEPITLVEGANAIRVRVPSVRRVEFVVEGLADATLMIEDRQRSGPFQRLKLDRQSKGAATLPDGAYRAIAQEGIRFAAVEFDVPGPSLITIALHAIERWTLQRLDPAGRIEALGLRIGDVLVACGEHDLGELDLEKWRALLKSDGNVAFGFERSGRRIEVRAPVELFLRFSGFRREFFDPQLSDR